MYLGIRGSTTQTKITGAQLRRDDAIWCEYQCEGHVLDYVAVEFDENCYGLYEK